MKNKITLKTRLKSILLFCLIAPFLDSVYAQVTVSESFDGTTFLPAGWSSVGSTTLWSRRTSGTFPTCANHSGAGMARFAARGSAAKTTQTIASPVVDLSNRGTNTPKVSLWLYRDNGSTLGDSLSVYINTTASLTSSVWIGTIARYSKLKMPDTVAANGWYQYTFNVPTGFNSSTNYFLFKGIGEAGYNIHIDDVQWEEYANPCTGTPSPGTISATTSLICNGSGSSILSLTGQTTGFSGLSFQWKVGSSPTGPFTNFGTNVTTISTGTIASSKYYKCVATCSFSSKSDSTTIKTILVNPNPNPVITFTPAAPNFCVGSTTPVAIKANSSTAKTFSWTPGTGLNRTDTSDVKSLPTATTTYTVTGTDSIGCKGSSTVTITLRQPPFVTLTSADSVMCLGDSIKLTATNGAGLTYLWSPTGQTVNSIFAKPIAKTNYSVTVKGTFGCATILNKNLYVIEKPKAKFGYTLNGRKVNFADSSINAKSYEWDFGDGNGSKKQNPVYIFVDDGNYTVKLIISNSPCKADTLIKIISIGSSGIHQTNLNSEIAIAPNPFKNLIKISISDNSTPELIIYNTLGEKVLNKNMVTNSETFDMSDFSGGVYTLVLINKSTVSTYRIVKTD